jgi:hypothetical protein
MKLRIPITIDSFINESKEFDDFKKRVIDKEIELVKYEEVNPDRESRIKRLLKLGLENDPKKFVKGYMRFTGATEHDLDDDFLAYL